MKPQARRDEISEARRGIMKKAALLFAQKGYGSVGTAEIGQVTGYGKGALYHHIQSKEDLLVDIMTVYLRDLLEDARAIIAAQPDATLRIHALSTSLMEAVVQDNAEMTVCFREVHALSPDRRRDVLRLHGDYFRLWEQVANDGRDAGRLRAIDADELKALLGMYFYSFLWIGPAREGDIESLSHKFAELVMRACKPS